jgi:hypothetical protein
VGDGPSGYGRAEAASIRLTLWDAYAASRAALFTTAFLALAFAVSAFTDEGHLGLLVRIGRVLPASPVCGAVGAWFALRAARARGEVLALESLGRSPLANGLAAATGGAAIVCIAALLVASFDAVDISGLYPRATRAEDYDFDGRDFQNVRRGFRVGPEGEVRRLADNEPSSDSSLKPIPRARTALASEASAPPGGRIAAALTLAIAGIALAFLAARTRESNLGRVELPLLDGAAVVVTVATSIVVFHAAAVGRVGPIAGCLPASLLLAWSLFRYVSPPWTTRRRN